MASVAEPGWHIVLFDIEFVPNVKPRLMSDGRAIMNVNASSIVQISFCDFNGKLLVPTANINPEVDWKNISGFTKYVERCWDVEAGSLPIVAKVYAPFREVMPPVLRQLRRDLGPRIILMAHNGKRCDFPIFKHQMEEAKIKFPFEVKVFDTQFIAKKLAKLADKKDKKWGLGHTYKVTYGEKLKNAHTSEADTLALARILRSHAVNHGAVTEKQCVNQLRFEKGMDDDFFASLIAVPPLVLPKLKDDLESKFKEMVKFLRVKDTPIRFSDPELETLFLEMSKLAIATPKWSEADKNRERTLTSFLSQV